MATPGTVPTKTLARLKSLAAAVSGLSGDRVSVGYVRETESADVYGGILGSGQPRLYLWFASRTRGVAARAGEFEIAGELLHPLPADASDDLYAAVDLVERLLDAWDNAADFPAGEVAPSDVSAPRFRADGVRSGILRCEFRLKFRFT